MGEPDAEWLVGQRCFVSYLICVATFVGTAFLIL